MIIGKQITIEANDIRESWVLYGKYEKSPMNSNFEGIFANINKEEFYKNELYWPASKIKRLINMVKNGSVRITEKPSNLLLKFR